MEEGLRDCLTEWLDVMLSEGFWIKRIDLFHLIRDQEIKLDIRSCCIGCYMGMANEFWFNLHELNDLEMTGERNKEFGAISTKRLVDLMKILDRLGYE